MPRWTRVRSDGPVAPPGFAESETPRYVGRGVAAIAADARRSRFNQQSVTSADLAREYGFTDLDGRQPDGWASRIVAAQRPKVDNNRKSVHQFR